MCTEYREVSLLYSRVCQRDAYCDLRAKVLLLQSVVFAPHTFNMTLCTFI